MMRARSPVTYSAPRERGRSPKERSPRGSGCRSPRGPRSPRMRDVSPASHLGSVRRERRNSWCFVPARPSASGQVAASAGGSECVRVILRVRPFNSMEEGRHPATPVVLPLSLADAPAPGVANGVRLIERRVEVREEVEEENCSDFRFDRVFYPSHLRSPPAAVSEEEQQELYDLIGTPCLNNLFDSFNSCILAYGQTGSGKTHSMMGVPEAPGIIPRFCRELLTKYEALPPLSQHSISLRVSFVEIYCEQLYDLMSPDTPMRRKLAIRQHPVHGVYVEGASSAPVSTWEEVEGTLRHGMAARSTAATSMNDVSSRSHAIFQITMEMQVQSGTLSTACVRFVDLAGSENLKKSGSDGARMQESIHINTSLLALRRIIEQLLERSAVPAYRESKLTRLLSDCLGGNSKTWFLACVGPSETTAEETKSTLRYAAKASRIVNHVTRNSDVGARIAEDLKQLREELSRAAADEGEEELKAMIAQYESAQASLQDDVTRLEKQVKDDRDAAHQAQTSLEEEVAALRREAVHLRRRLDEKQQDRRALEEMLLEAETTAAAVQEEALREQAEAFRERLREAEEVAEELRRQRAEDAEEKRRLEEALAKERVQHAALLAAAEQRLEEQKKDFEAASAAASEHNAEERQALAQEVRGLRVGLEQETRQRRMELAQQRDQHDAALRREAETAASAQRRMREAERRASSLEDQFQNIEADLRGMEEVHGKTQRILSAADELQHEDASEDLRSLVRDVNSWGRQLKSLRTNFLTLTNHRGRPGSDEYLPSTLELTPDPSQGRHRRSSSSRRLRKL